MARPSPWRWTISNKIEGEKCYEITKNFYPPPKNSVNILICISILLLALSGCSGSKTPVTSSDDPDLRCEKIGSYSNSNEFWKFAYKSIPTVTYHEITSGDYDSSYICIDGVVLYSDIETLVAFPENGNVYTDKGFLTDDALGDDLIENEEITVGSSVKICTYISGGSMNYSPVAIRKINAEFDLDIKKYIKERNARLETSSYIDGLLESETTESSETTPSSEETEQETVTVSSKPVPYTLEYGQLLDANPDGGINMNSLIIKAKIEPNITDRLTITQNYQNIIKMVQARDYTRYDEIQYWAIADMSDGSEGKVISFTVDNSCIKSIASGAIASGDTLEQYLTDLWILPSLQD